MIHPIGIRMITLQQNQSDVGVIRFITFRIHKTMMDDDPNKNNRRSHAQHHAMDRMRWAERDESRPYAVPTNIDKGRNPTTR